MNSETGRYALTIGLTGVALVAFYAAVELFNRKEHP